MTDSSKSTGEGTSGSTEGSKRRFAASGDIIDPFDPDDSEVNVHKLAKAAKKWFNRFERYDLTWEEWKAALKKAFPRRYDFAAVLEELVLRRKEPTETMSIIEQNLNCAQDAAYKVETWKRRPVHRRNVLRGKSLLDNTEAEEKRGSSGVTTAKSWAVMSAGIVHYPRWTGVSIVEQKDIQWQTKIGSQCKSRWNNIRDNFKKSWGKRKTKSGQAAKKSKPYRFENQLQFLLEFMEERETKGNIGLHPDSENGEFNDDNEEETRLTNNIVSPPQSSNQPSSPPFEEHPTTSNDIPSTSAACFARPTPVTGRKKTPQHETAASALMKYVIENNEGKKNTPTVTLDNPIDCFLFGISATMKSMPPYLQHLAKSEIFSTVQKYELQMLQNQQGQEVQRV
ncbi:uncharacterized protein LOC106670533 [Cimex lectularius]|uniref:Uncharacterized protein n=1 Tax=Cimex lectularius TaxID=79782 RepID=A0A8I6SLJ7_CIMLE|nr:uncharacterized protein LOC106670533 [Cimex lectularius]